MVKRRKIIQVIAFFLAASAVINFASVLIHIGAVGGSADTIENGRFYVWAKTDYGRRFEVSAATYYGLKIHEESLWITHPIGLLAAAILLRTSTRQSTGMPNAVK